jgi:hypothetical protein
MTQTHTRRVARSLLTASVGLVLVAASAGRAARDEGVPMAPLARLTEPDGTAGSGRLPAAWPAALSRQVMIGAVFSPGNDEDQPAGACWLAGAGSCLCSAGSIEDLLTPDFMRVLLTSWRDTGRLTAGEWRERLREVDTACGSRSVAP